MHKVIRTTASLIVGLALFSALTMAQAGASNADKNKNGEHHSRFAKAAFWRHHKDTDKKTKQAQAKPTQAKPAQAKQVAGKTAPAKTAQVKPMSAKQTAGKTDQKSAQHSGKTIIASAKKAPAKTTAKTQTTHATKPPQKAEASTTDSTKK